MFKSPAIYLYQCMNTDTAEMFEMSKLVNNIFCDCFFDFIIMGIPMKSAAYSDGSRPGIPMKSATP